MARFIIETDLGHDPDDLFAICHLLEAGHEILAISLVPGSVEQIHLATGLRRYLGLSYEVGIQKGPKNERLGIHDELIRKLGLKADLHDAGGSTVIARALTDYPDADILVIGPAPSLRQQVEWATGKLTMQGGFLPYSAYRPSVVVPDLEGKEWMPTFNFNGDRKAVDAIAAAPLSRRQWCGKNVCHSILLTRAERERMATARGKAGEVYLLAMDLYLARHDYKKMHDPTALVCHLHPEVATWFRGRPVRREGGWTTSYDPEGDHVLADVDREKLWSHLLQRT